jgi:GH15 family glucan-1,4-alpha-glucosidase
LQDFDRSTQRYLPNTAILETTLYDKKGGIIQITDFAPRFTHFGRSFRPTQVFRMVKRVAGHPVVVHRLRPRKDFGKNACNIVRGGSNHLKLDAKDFRARVTTDAPLSFLEGETPFVVQQDFTIVIGPDESMTSAPHQIASEFLEKTRDYWHTFTRSLNIPFQWQSAVIRAAITLKLCSFEETGGILAAMTTSIPEAPDTVRNWDYRYCWLRDSFHTVRTLNRLGATTTMERYIEFLINIIHTSPQDSKLQPLYGLGLDTTIKEYTVDIKGYRGMGPVRVGNAAYTQQQNDNYGSIILSVTQMFFDRRLPETADESLFHTLERLGEISTQVYDKQDAGLWELRNSAHVHTFSSAMCWAACDRLQAIAYRLKLPERRDYWKAHADKIREYVLENAWDEKAQTFVGALNTDIMDASVLLMAELGIIDPMDPRFVSTVEAVGKKLRVDDFLLRYDAADDFGMPEVSFTICTFWYIDALVYIGRKDEALKLFENLLRHRNHLGIMSEDICFETHELWGNFPQTYSMCGIINSAMLLSEQWASHGL